MENLHLKGACMAVKREQLNNSMCFKQEGRKYLQLALAHLIIFICSVCHTLNFKMCCRFVSCITCMLIYPRYAVTVCTVRVIVELRLL